MTDPSRKGSQICPLPKTNQPVCVHVCVCQCVSVNIHQEQVWTGGHVWTGWHLQHGGCCGTLRFHGNGPPGSSHKWQRCRPGYETSSTAPAPEEEGQELQLHTPAKHFIPHKAHAHTSVVYLEDGVHDATERSVVGEFCYSEYVKTPLIQILQLLFKHTHNMMWFF